LKVRPGNGGRTALRQALARVDGSDPAQATPSAWRGIDKALADILTVCPGLSEEEIQRRVHNYHSHMPRARLTAFALAKHWALCANPIGPDGENRRRAAFA